MIFGIMISIYETKDGSKTLLNTELNETYHSRNGAIQESLHVFLGAGFQDFTTENPQLLHISVLEIGFGTGLNALLTLQKCLDNPAISVYYESLETYPLDYEQVKDLGYLEQIQDPRLEEYFEKMHQTDWNKPFTICSNFVLHKKNMSLRDFQSEQMFHIVYFDAFAPNVQPEMWEIENLRKIKNNMLLKGFFVTYCAKGQLKRDLKELGFLVERLSGPPGKREMTRALLSYEL